MTTLPTIINKLPQQPEPRVFDKLAKLAGIKESPYPFPKVIFGVTFFTTVREEFEREIVVALAAAHDGAALIGGSKKLLRSRAIAREAKALADTLGRVRTEEKDILAFFLPHRRSEVFDDFIVFTRELAKCAKDVLRMGKVSKRATGLRVMRRALVSALLNAAATAGGKLTVNKRSESGSLVEARDLLKPYLPPEISRHLSFGTLVTLHSAWVKNRKKK
jgi:hypothetical protein